MVLSIPCSAIFLASSGVTSLPAAPKSLPIDGIILKETTSKAVCGTAATAALPRLASSKDLPVSIWRERLDPVNCPREASPAPARPTPAPTPRTLAPTPAANGAAI